ncbi:hypothetical protein [Polyangium jinanense]|uniref:Uncharacterized protein n=1 Tax=Polyangium jinanense TaxID=2829994 RepID=A0A9X3XF51_9BACT|nr:hypothetical protein [Polyangium jinanense]MDC3960678.1 hypothetical protein [Polyangium jinanense]MDC3986966.1 hypothetical protein [Polyangium jinanense]
MLSLLRAFLQSLRAALRPPPAPPAPPATRAHVDGYRTSARTPDEPSPWFMSVTLSTARKFSIVLYEFHESRGQPRNGTRLARVDPPGLLEGWSITSVHQYFWQYLWFGVIFFHRGPERYEALLVERLGPGAREDVCRELSMGASGAQPADGNRVFAALIDRHESYDGSTGYHADLAIGRLCLSADGEAWSYEREVLWFETEEGSPYS